MDESRKQFEEYVAKKLRLPFEMITEARNGDRYFAFSSMDIRHSLMSGGLYGRHREQLLNWISTGQNRMTTFGKMVKKVLMRWVMRMGVTKR